MREETITIKHFKFDELNEKAKSKAIEKLWDLNIEYDWWDYIYEDAKRIGCNITEFDIDRGSFCTMDFSNDYLIDIAKNIIKEHGEACNTYKLASEYIINHKSAYDAETDSVPMSLNRPFIDSLQEEYLSMLRREYEHLTSEEAIVDSIESNEYEFDENGNLN